MRLWLELAPPWQARAAERDDEALVFVWPELGVRLHTTRLHARPDPEGTAAVSMLGWPVELVEPDPTTIRVVYHLLEMAGTVVVTGPAAAMAAHHEQLLQAALAARPDWTDKVACVADLFVDVAFAVSRPDGSA